MNSLSFRLGGVSALALGLICCFDGVTGLQASAEDSVTDTEIKPALQDVIIVTGTRTKQTTQDALTPDAAPLEGVDITYLTARTPGGARVANGELSGQMQYRGLFGERLNLRVDGQRFASGGPNLMDPAFHYAPSTLVASVVIDRGVSPVSEGPGLAGGADAIFKRIGYSDSEAITFGYDFGLGGRSVNESVAAGGVIGAAGETWRFNLLGSYEDGEDTEFPDGTIGGTAYTRAVYGASSGVRFGGHEVTLDVRRHEAGPAGNPPFPMDIRFMDTDFAQLGYAGQFGEIGLTAKLSYADVSHAMNNFDNRPAPPTMRLRETFTYATTKGAEVAIAFDAVGGRLSLGFDGEEVEHTATITNPANADFSVTPFPDITLERFGGFGEWTGAVGLIEAELGFRVDQHEFEAGQARLGSALPMGPRIIAAAFNAAERDGEETTVDLVARVWTPAKDGWSWRGTLARKQQMPGYIQRYGWLPISASGGLADGNIYVGDLGLDPETALIVEGGFDYFGKRSYMRPTVYVRRIDDYIQGVAFDDTPGVLDTPQEMIANMNGDSTPLIWANVDAQLVGFDLDAGYDFDGPLRVDAVVNYVRGERRDISDDLYRVSPPSVMAGLTWEETDWSATFELRAVDEQKNVSLTNSEEPTSGYVVASLYGDWQVRDGVRLSAGVENLFNESYRDHLSGYNRNGFGDVGVGERLPGAGRGVFLRMSIAG